MVCDVILISAPLGVSFSKLKCSSRSIVLALRCNRCWEKSPGRSGFTPLFASSMSFPERERGITTRTCTWNGKNSFFVKLLVQ